MTRSYEKIIPAARKIFCSEDRLPAALRLGISFDETCYYPVFLGNNYRIFRSDGTCQVHDEKFGWRNADYLPTMTLYDLMCFSHDPVTLSGTYTFFVNLTKMQTGNVFAGKGILEDAARAFDAIPSDRFTAAISGIGGCSFDGKGDVSARIPVFGPIDILLNFWYSDEDFPPSLRLYADEKLLNYMHYETVWYLMDFVIRSILGSL